MRDRRHVHEGVVFLEIDVAVRLAERPFRLERVGADKTFDDVFGLGRHHEIDGLGAHHVDRTACQRAGNRQFVEMVRHLVARSVRD